MTPSDTPTPEQPEENEDRDEQPDAERPDEPSNAAPDESDLASVRARELSWLGDYQPPDDETEEMWVSSNPMMDLSAEDFDVEMSDTSETSDEDVMQSTQSGRPNPEPDTANADDSQPDTPANVPELSSQVGAPDDQQAFEDLTLAQVTGLFVRRPVETARKVMQVAATPRWRPRSQVVEPQDSPPPLPLTGDSPEFGGERLVVEPATPESFVADRIATESEAPKGPGDTIVNASFFDAPPQRIAIRFMLWVVAFTISLIGNGQMRAGEVRVEQEQLANGTPFLIAAFLVWLGAEVYWNWPHLRNWWANRRQRDTSVDEKAPESTDLPPIPESDKNRAGYMSNLGVVYYRVALFMGTAVAATIAYAENANNQFTTIGFWAWVASIVMVVLAVAPRGWDIFAAWRWIRGKFAAIEFNWTVVALAAIMLLAGVFRFQDFAGVPPEMTSDHVEKILDSQRVVEGTRDVFFTGNGGREIFQMYAMALITQIPGIEMNFATLKLLSIIEGMLTIPLLWWMGREVVGRYDSRLGNLVGLSLAALVAASYWHVGLSRLALRIVLTPLVATLLVIYLGRGMRDNRRSDFIIAGLVLGFGLYMYQAVRMLPVVVLAGVAIAAIMKARTLEMWSKFTVNLATLVLVSFIVFVPLFRFSLDFPDLFWMRTAGRLLGDSIIQEFDAEGNVVGERNATITERIDAFSGNLPILGSNMRNALLMYNWKGDVAWINGVPNEPTMSLFGGALLIVGLAAWTALGFRTRDPVIVLIPVMVLIMLLPSALSIAFPIENPSAARTSGSLPPAYLIAALPLALLALSMLKLAKGRSGPILATGLVAAVTLLSYSANSNLYLDDYKESYISSSLPYTEAGNILEGFANSDGSYGNAFMIAYPFWWDHRAIGMEGGVLDWPNGIVTREQVPDFVYDSTVCRAGFYATDPARDLLFFYHRDDADTEALLSEWFPNGRILVHRSYQFNDDFKTYRVLAPGLPALTQFFDSYTVNRRC